MILPRRVYAREYDALVLGSSISFEEKTVETVETVEISEIKERFEAISERLRTDR